MTERLATGVWAGALVRRVHAAGGFATIIHKGDETAGAVVLLFRRRDGSCAALTRVAQKRGGHAWMINLDQPQDRLEIINQFLDKQRSYDPDLWIIELDIADPERFIDEPVLRS